jgi:hypothetical protein
MGVSDDDIGAVEVDSECKRDNNIDRGSAVMRIGLRSITPLLVAGAAAAAIATAPAATARPTPAPPAEVTTAPTGMSDHVVPVGNGGRLHGGGWDGVHGFGGAF